MTVPEIVAKIQGEVDKRANAVAGVEGSFQFVLTGSGGGAFHAKASGGRVEVMQGTMESPSVTITVSAEDFDALVHGRLNAAGAFMTGKLKIEGDIGLALRLQNLLG